MRRTLKEELLLILRRLELDLKETEAVVLLTKRGLPVACRLPAELKAEMICGTIAMVFGTAESVREWLGKRKPLLLHIQAERCEIVATEVSEDVLLALYLRPGAKLGHAVVVAKTYGELIGKTLERFLHA